MNNYFGLLTNISNLEPASSKAAQQQTSTTTNNKPKRIPPIVIDAQVTKSTKDMSDGIRKILGQGTFSSNGLDVTSPSP